MIRIFLKPWLQDFSISKNKFLYNHNNKMEILNNNNNNSSNKIKIKIKKIVFLKNL